MYRKSVTRLQKRISIFIMQKSTKNSIKNIKTNNKQLKFYPNEKHSKIIRFIDG